MSTVLASAADERYGHWLLNMVGSVQARSPRTFDRIVLYDLGLTPLQARLARSIRGVEVRTVPPFVPHWREGRTWKTWIWAHAEADRLVWLDAGLSVLRPLDELLAQVDERGYFVVSQGHLLSESIPSDYYERFSLPRELADRVQVAAGILAFRRGSDFDERVIQPAFEAASEGFSVGFSAEEVAKLNRGLDRSERPVVRNCPIFRHEQTLLNICLYRAYADPVVNDLDRFAGFRSRNDHPEQVIWSHRRRGDLAYLPRVRYRAMVAPFALLYGWAYRLHWWRVNHSWLFKPSTYARKAARLLRHAS